MNKKTSPSILVISGISGAGKTTLGSLLKDYLLSKGKKVVVLDGDELRKFFDGGLAYSSFDRLMVSKIIVYGACLLQAQGIYVILTTMLSQEGAREFLRSKTEFVDIYLNADINQCKKNDVKSVYQRNLNLEKPNIVGHDQVFCKPEEPDLVISTHTESQDESFEKIKFFLFERKIFGFENGQP